MPARGEPELADGDSRTYRVPDSVSTGRLDVSDGPARFLVEVGSDLRFRVSAGVLRIVTTLQRQPLGYAELLECLRSECGDGITDEKLSWLLHSVLIPSGIVAEQGHEAGAAGTDRPEGVSRPAPEDAPVRLKKRSSYLWLKVPLVGPESIRPLTSRLSLLFRPPMVATTLVLSLVAHLVFYLEVVPRVTWRFESVSLVTVLAVMAVLNLTTVFHELGHATASHHYGCPHGKIGWGIYLFFFVLYTDVSQAWRLDRRKRAVIDLAGIYFELMAAVVLLAVYLASGRELFVYALILIDFGIVASLNPVLRRDGYWLLSDLSGQPNLRDANLETIRRSVARLRGKPPGETHESDRPTWLVVVLYVYTASTIAFTVWFLVWISRRLMTDILPSLRTHADRLGDALQASPLELTIVAEILGRLAFGLLFLGIVAFTGWRFVRGFIRLLRPKHSRVTDRGFHMSWEDA